MVSVAPEVVNAMNARSLSRLLIAPLLAAAATPAIAGSTKTTSTWAAPDLQPRTYGKVAVVAKISDDIARRTLEDAVVKGLIDRGISAVASYQTFTAADLASPEAVEAKAKELGVDAGLIFSVTGKDAKVNSGPTVHASVGVPVRAGPFSMFLGTSVPLGGGTAVVPVATVKSEFFSAGNEDALWIASYTTDLRNGNERAAEEIASHALKQIKKAHLFE